MDNLDELVIGEVANDQPCLYSLFNVLGLNESLVCSILEQAQIAGDEIEAAMERHPDERDRVWSTFHLLTPTGVLGDMPHNVYRAYCAEMLDRVANGEDTRLATRAEMMMMLSATSLKTPLTHTAISVYCDLFIACFGKDTLIGVEEGLDYVQAQPYLKDELLNVLARRMIQENRKFDESKLRRAP